MNVKFTINGVEIEQVSEFKCLGRYIQEADNDIVAVWANIQKARKRWGQFSRILTREGANIKHMKTFYITIVQSVLLYGSESWTLTENQWSLIAAFHNQCARSITRRWARQNEDGTWHWPSISETLRIAGLDPIHQYVTKRRATIFPFIEDRAVYEKCLNTTWNPSTAHKVVWWE